MTDAQEKNGPTREREGEQDDSKKPTPAPPQQVATGKRPKEKVEEDAKVEVRFQATDN
jgi:hypothetical protein